MNRPKDERDILNLPKPDAKPQVHERETFRSDGSSMELEAVGKRHQGMDGKRYCGSIAVHIYNLPFKPGEYIYMFQTTDLTKIPEGAAAAALPELGRVVMQRYGRKPPAKTTDKYVKESEQKLAGD